MSVTSLQRSETLTPAPPAGATIHISGITHRYGDRLALDSVSFDVRSAEIFGLLGLTVRSCLCALRESIVSFMKGFPSCFLRALRVLRGEIRLKLV